MRPSSCRGSYADHVTATALLLVGLALLVVGVWFLVGWPAALVTTGVACLVLAVLDARSAVRETPVIEVERP